MRAILAVRDLEEEGKFIFFATRNGTVKKTPLKDFSNVMSRGIIAIGIDKGRRTGSAPPHRRPTDHLPRYPRRHGHPLRDEGGRSPHGPPRLRRSRHGPQQGRLHRRHGRHAEGTDAQQAKSNTKANGRAEEEERRRHAIAEEKPIPNMILSVTENGYGKRTAVDEYRLTGRGGKGIINVKTTERNGKVVGILLVSEDTEAMLISPLRQDHPHRHRQIREAGRSTQGVRLLKLDAGDKVAAAVVIPDEEKEDTTGTLLQ